MSTVLSSRRRAAWLAALPLLLASVAACDKPSATEPIEFRETSTASSAGAETASSLTIGEFIAAQGTWCTAAGGPTGCTNLFGPGGPADVPVWCDYNTDPYFCFYGDLGVWERFVKEQTGAGFGSEYGGQVTERPLNDGRRLVKISVHGKNVLTLGIDEAALQVHYADPVGIANAIVVGASPHEMANDLREPTLGDLQLDLELILPTDYVGLPDLVELLFEPPDGMEFLSMRWVSNVQGVTRMAFGAVPAGVPARVVTNMSWNVELEGKLPVQARANGLRVTGFSPGYHVELRQTGR